MTTDELLLERLKFRDEAALELIYDQYYLLLWKVCSRNFNDQVECERVLTEVFHQLWKCPQHFSGDKRLLFYLIECTNSKIASMQRNRQCRLNTEKTCS